MRKSIRLVSMVSLLSLVTGVAGAAVVNKIDCEVLGYTTPLSDCKAAGGTPLFCPFFNAKDKPMTLCLTKSCRGYPLIKDDLDSKASDGKTIWEHVESYDTCTTSPTEGSITYYKVVKCKSSSLYQNNICDVGCLAERYPYDSHQGNIAGDMRRCDDSTGEHYGYETCNDGWEGGWVKKRTGKCELSTCDVKNFPYSSNPNTYYNRGITKQCLVGGNPYYRYSLTDLMDNPSDEACGVANEYTLVNAVCQKKCVFNDCSKKVVNQTLSGIPFSYNEWSCKLQTEDCRIGDEAVINGVSAGIVAYLPTDSNDWIRIFSMDGFYAKMANGAYEEEGIPLPTNGCNVNAVGIYNDKFTVAYAIEKNKTSEYPYEFPAVDARQNYAPSGCSGVCGKGEWYIPTCWELMEMYKNKYILFNVTKNKLGNTLVSSTLRSSSYTWGRYNIGIVYSGADWTGSVTTAAARHSNSWNAPMISFKLK